MTVPLDLVLPILVNCYLNLHIHMHTVDTGTPSISISITVIIIFTCVTTSRTCIFWGTLKGTASPTPPLNGNAKSGGGVCPHHRSPHQIRDHKGAFSPIPETLGKSTPPSPFADGWCCRAETKGGADAGDGLFSAARSTQSAAE